jgi:hypothetical protein
LSFIDMSGNTKGRSRLTELDADGRLRQCHSALDHAKRLLFFLWLYSPILGLDLLRETFRFISVTRSRAVGRTPWTGDQLVARPLLTDPGDCEDGEVCGMNGFDRGNRSTRKKTCSDATLSTCQTRARTRAAAVGSQQLTA